ncbi:MAG: hypothetical protein L0099_02540 [Acidobacteria bacterium]|nr:hypothetical protein [Acidobacteriota bacterium]
MSRLLKYVLVLTFLPLLPLRAWSQEQIEASVTRDPQAAEILAQAVAAMGGTVPADSRAEGKFERVAGSSTDAGTVRVLTRGTTQSTEQIESSDGKHEDAVYSQGEARRAENGTAGKATLELAASSQSALFPLPLLYAALTDTSGGLEFVGVEALEGRQALHLRFWKSYPQPRLRHLSDFSRREAWIDAQSGLPVKLAWVEREALGPEEGLRVEVFYSDFRSVGGVLYPFLVTKSLNGTPALTIRIDSVVFNTGASDADFAVN